MALPKGNKTVKVQINDFWSRNKINQANLISSQNPTSKVKGFVTLNRTSEFIINGLNKRK
jgi:hypothetical protein